MSGVGKGHAAAGHGHAPCHASDCSSDDSDFVQPSRRRRPAKPAAQQAAPGKRAAAAPQARPQQLPAAANQRRQQQTLQEAAAAPAKPPQQPARQQAQAADGLQRPQHPPVGKHVQPPARPPAGGQAPQGAGGVGRPPKPSAPPLQKRKGQAASGAGAAVRKKAKAAAPPPRRAEGPADSGSSGSSSSGDDDFIAGSLRPALLPAAAVKIAPKAAPKGKQQGGGGGHGGGRSGHGDVGRGPAAAATADPGFGERVEAIRLDSLELARWPGWQASAAGIRRVVPWTPGGGALAAGAARDGGAGAAARVVLTPSLLSYNLGQLGGGFQGVLLQLDALGGDGCGGSHHGSHHGGHGGEQPAASGSGGGSGAPAGSPSWQQLEALQLGGVVANGLVFFWASKAAVAPAVRWMARQGFKLVENLTWLLLGANGAPLQLPAPLLNRSHATLLIGRRGDQKKQHLELRHQRTPDVIAAPALAPGQVPEAAYEMIETLLPDARAAAASGAAPRLLELAWAVPPAGRTARPGWITVAQQKAGQRASE